VTQATTPATKGSRPRLGLPARLAILSAVFFAEKVLLNGLVDSDRVHATQGLGPFVRVAQHWGFRFLVAFAAALAVFAYVRKAPQPYVSETELCWGKRNAGWALAHVFLVAALVPLTYFLFGNSSVALPFVAAVTISMALGTTAALAGLLTMAPWPLWVKTARSLGNAWVYALIAAILGTGVWQFSEKLWTPAATLTFDIVRLLLAPIIPTLIADGATRMLSTDRFAVEVTEVCSGLEGMGLVLVFSVAWLLYFRREYIFPRALVLIPVGLTAIFVLNAGRIAALMLIGYEGYPDVAEFGFHSQAGWIAFNTVACGLAFFSRRNPWLNRTARSAAPATSDNPTAAYLMPLLAILAAGAISHSMSGNFETFYPLRLIAASGMLCLYYSKLATLDWRWSWRGPAVGLCAFFLWMAAARFQLPATSMPEGLTALSPAARIVWITIRVAASVITVPIAEELAYRGYLMRRFSGADFESVPFRSVRWPALTAAAVVFGLAHGALWLPGIAAGLAFGLIVVRRGGIGEAVAAHATTNALIAASVIGWNQWQLW
jgi:exosortase E/protease (VPEID-CTERM system)